MAKYIITVAITLGETLTKKEVKELTKSLLTSEGVNKVVVRQVDKD